MTWILLFCLWPLNMSYMKYIVHKYELATTLKWCVILCLVTIIHFKRPQMFTFHKDVASLSRHFVSVCQYLTLIKVATDQLATSSHVSHPPSSTHWPDTFLTLNGYKQSSPLEADTRKTSESQIQRKEADLKTSDVLREIIILQKRWLTANSDF